MVLRYPSHKMQNRLSPKPQIFIGRLVHSTSLHDLEVIAKGALGVHANGDIAFVRSFNRSSDRSSDEICKEEGFKDAESTYLEPSQFLMPGLIDTHLHAPQWPNLALGMEGRLREWVENWTNPVEVG